ncbi:glycerol-3-phosphate cytidylyltransferase [Enterococcus columbae DSM 7374 = ATCC 51263]|nr:glycerol-3-phosphate cytidylyltransferase [Enterococcus columbae DSM 7374 = ATCC 51263]
MLHEGHINLLKKAKALGDYLIVGVTTTDFDKNRGKINVQQSLMERIEAIKELGLADEIIIEEYEGQKIDDIKNLNIDIFTVGSDWKGKFDYLKEYCEVVYLPRTEGISSSDIRSKQKRLKLGLVGETLIRKFKQECTFVNGVDVVGVCSTFRYLEKSVFDDISFITSNYSELLARVDAIYIEGHPNDRYFLIKKALECGKHVLCESPIAQNAKKYDELLKIADTNKCVLMDAIKTAYSTAYSRLFLLLKSGIIGDVVSIDVTCTSLADKNSISGLDVKTKWNSMTAWGPTAMLPIFQLLGINYQSKKIITHYLDCNKTFDLFSKLIFIYSNSVATITIGKGVKSEGSMVITGTEGYIYVPAPWWKMDYFEVRFEDYRENKRYYYTLEGEGIRYEIIAFINQIKSYNSKIMNISAQVSREICRTIQDFNDKKDVIEIRQKGLNDNG